MKWTEVCAVIGGGSVVRPTVADVHINVNYNELIFKDNQDVATLWPGITVCIVL